MHKKNLNECYMVCGDPGKQNHHNNNNNEINKYKKKTNELILKNDELNNKINDYENNIIIDYKNVGYFSHIK